MINTSREAQKGSACTENCYPTHLRISCLSLRRRLYASILLSLCFLALSCERGVAVISSRKDSDPGGECCCLPPR